MVTAKSNDTFLSYNRKFNICPLRTRRVGIDIFLKVYDCVINFIWELRFDAVHSCWAYQNASSRLDDDEYDQDLEEPTIKSLTDESREMLGILLNVTAVRS